MKPIVFVILVLGTFAPMACAMKTDRKGELGVTLHDPCEALLKKLDRCSCTELRGGISHLIEHMIFKKSDKKTLTSPAIQATPGFWNNHGWKLLWAATNIGCIALGWYGRPLHDKSHSSGSRNKK